LGTVAERAAARQSLCKADIGSLVLWKRITAQTEWAKEFCAYPKRILEEAIAELCAEDLEAADGVDRWLEVTRRVGSDWLTARREIEAEWARKRATNPTPWPRCRRPLGAELCECG
jgi:hypothetical protein